MSPIYEQARLKQSQGLNGKQIVENIRAGRASPIYIICWANVASFNYIASCQPNYIASCQTIFVVDPTVWQMPATLSRSSSLYDNSTLVLHNAACAYLHAKGKFPHACSQRVREYWEVQDTVPSSFISSVWHHMYIYIWPCPLTN